MNPSQSQLHRIRELAQQLSGELADLQTILSLPDVPIEPQPSRLVMSWPCGDIARRQLAPWFDATGYGTLYNGGKAYHTGHDLNLHDYGDSGARVVAVADGEIVFAGVVKGWQGWVVVVRHVLEDGRLFWTRYAHITDVTPIGQIKRGDLLGYICDYLPAGKANDHLHIDGAWCDLGKKPGDWPCLDLARLKVDYFDLVKMIQERLP
jgi:murein DD-endopeptidase MepM/ murein hydrolase activator NlpD